MLVRQWRIIFAAMLLTTAAQGVAAEPTAKADGYRGIWFTLGQKSEYGDKYSGGLATYTANHVPMAVYSPQANKTFFVYGGTKPNARHLLAMISYYDHKRGVVPRPTIVHDKQGVDDPHDNPSLAIDGQGRLWVFVSGRGRARPGIIYRSRLPHDIEAFERVLEAEFTYPQPRWIEGTGFLHLFTKYTGVRELYWSTSVDGKRWSEDRKFAGIGGHYQTSELVGKRLITAFNMHPGGNVDKRTNLYFLQTDDLGKTWKNVAGAALETPLSKPENQALVRNYRDEKQLVYIHDLGCDAQGRPLILYTTSGDFRPGPGGDPRCLTVARWLGQQWDFVQVCRMNHNYTTGALYFEGDRDWRIIAPTERGPQAVGAGGEVAAWTSHDGGQTWNRQRDVTRQSRFNHNYVRRPVNAHDDFYAFWADGNPDEPSASHLYFTQRDGRRVWRLPAEMKEATAVPDEVVIAP